MTTHPRILQVGYGAFGATHLDAWAGLVPATALTVADPRPDARAAAAARVPGIAVVADWRDGLAAVDAVDVLTPTDTHHAIAAAAIAAGRHLFLEKPMTVDAAEARDLEARAARTGVTVQGGLYFRFHPKARALHALVRAGGVGRLRFLQGKFAGFKRARGDSGALLNDAVHFIDLFGWLAGERPATVHCVTRDHFGRGSEDLALATLVYPSGVVAHVETGYIQPGRWPDTVVPGAVTSKEVQVSGSEGAVEIDFAAETMVRHRVRHEFADGLWRPVFAGSAPVAAEAADPVAVVRAELAHFLDCIARRRPPDAGLAECGVGLALVLDAARRSAATGTVARVEA
ncbi:Gfo/Idh/MocA family protein [Stella sp.]|uniref:Gfo/Idh/MocA family protein n=1 Tax=Stella sp. TaxID=2912054 RepID=UPI0035AFE734